MEEEREESGISIGDIFRTIFSQKWLALIIAVIITIVGTVGLYLIGKSDMEYSISFVLQLPDTEDSPSTYLYPDGKKFSYTDYISLEMLETVKASDSGYANIDVEKIVQDGDITIVRTLTEIAEGTKEYDSSYKLNIKAKYFKDRDVVRNFMVALAENPVAYIAEMNVNYDYNIISSQNALTYELQLNELEGQVTALQNLYSSFIDSYGSNYVVEINGTSTSLAQLKFKSVDEYLNKGLFGALRREAYDNGYVKSTTDTRERDKYESDKKALEEKLLVANNTLTELKALQASVGSVVIYADSIRAQIIEVEQLKLELEQHVQKYLDNYDKGEVNTTFKAKVKAVENEVRQMTEEIKPVASYVYKNVSKVNVPTAAKITVEGGRSLILSGAISLVVGIVLAAIVAYIVGWSRQKKTVKCVQTVAEIPVFVEAQAQTAVTEDKEDIKEDK